MPSFLTDVLEQLGWSDGTFLPVSNEENKSFEKLLEERNKELLRLKSETDIQSVKQNELDLHRANLLAEHQANMHLLVVHKEQMDGEDHRTRVAATEAGRSRQDAELMERQYKDLERKAEGLQADIARVLRRVESRRTEIGEDRNALEEWKSALKRGEADIDAIEKFSKEDNAKIAEMDGKRQRLKVEYDAKQLALSQLCCNLQAEERGLERLSHQVEEALTQRRHTIATWAGAVENLRQRDKDIQQMKQELTMLREYCGKRGEQLQEKQDFLATQRDNNAEAERETRDLKAALADERLALSRLQEFIRTMDAEYTCMKRELQGTANQLTNCRLDNKRMDKERSSKQDAIENLQQQIQNYKEKLAEVMDGSKTAAQRTRQLEEMLASEEKYVKQLMSENDRLQHCVFRSQQQLAGLKEEGNLTKLTARGYRVAMNQLDIKLTKIDKELLGQKEILYKLSFTLEKAVGRCGRLEGTRADPGEEEALARRAAQLQAALDERGAALQLLAAQLSRLDGEERALARDQDANQRQHALMKERMQELTASAEGARRWRQRARQAGRARRAEEGALRLRLAHAARALQRLGGRSLSLEKAGAGLKAAVVERTAEAGERLGVLGAQRRGLQDERGSLYADLRAEQLQLEVLRKKYDICISTMGKDEDGHALSVTYFKVKNAQEKAELQQEGDALDIQIRKSEKEIAALEATLKVVDTANRNFIRSLAPPEEDDPEVLELAGLNGEFQCARQERAQLAALCHQRTQRVDTLRGDLAALTSKLEALENAREEALDELAVVQKELSEQREKLSRANTQLKRARLAAKRAVQNSETMAQLEVAIECRMLAEANKAAAEHLARLELPEVEERARQQGLDLAGLLGGSQSSKKLGVQSGRSSIASGQGSLGLEPSKCSCVSSTSLGTGVASPSSGIRDELNAARAPRSPLSDSQDKISSRRFSSQPHGKKNMGGSSMPLSVVLLGLDTEPVRDVPRTAGRKSSTTKK